VKILISISSGVLECFTAAKKLCVDLVQHSRSPEAVVIIIFLIVTAAGISANGLWEKRQKGDYP
jgi:hypothetical protein